MIGNKIRCVIEFCRPFCRPHLARFKTISYWRSDENCRISTFLQQYLRKRKERTSFSISANSALFTNFSSSFLTDSTVGIFHRSAKDMEIRREEAKPHGTPINFRLSFHTKYWSKSFGTEVGIANYLDRTWSKWHFELSHRPKCWRRRRILNSCGACWYTIH